MTPTAYLIAQQPVDELEHTVEAIMPTREQQRLARASAITSLVSLCTAGAGAKATS